MEKSTLLILLLIAFLLLLSFNNKSETFVSNQINDLTKNMKQITQNELEKKKQKKVNFSSNNLVNLFNYNDSVDTINNNPIVNEPMKQKFWIDEIRELYPLQDNPVVDFVLPENSNNKFKFKQDNGDDKSIAELFEDARGELVNDITDEQLNNISGKDINQKMSNVNFTESVLLDNYDTPFRNRETNSKYTAFNGNSFGSLI